MTLWPKVTVAELALFEMERSAVEEDWMVTFSDPELLAVLASGSLAVTATAFVTTPVDVGITTMVTVGVAPRGTVPKATVIVPTPKVMDPWLAATETRVAGVGNVSTRVTPVADAGPGLANEME